MVIVGLAGGSGTGKSTIAHHLESQGAGYIDADEIAQEVLRSNEEVRQRIRERFGIGAFDGDKIDRAALGERVFSDGEALAALSAIVHPAIIDVCRERIERFRKEGKDLVVIDAALLLEVDMGFPIDLLIALRCASDEQIRRLLAIGGFSRDQIEARLKAQEHLEKSFYRADVVVDTDRPKSEVLTEIERIVRFLRGS